jgi:hypothetical protein
MQGKRENAAENNEATTTAMKLLRLKSGNGKNVKWDQEIMSSKWLFFLHRKKGQVVTREKVEKDQIIMVMAM